MKKLLRTCLDENAIRFLLEASPDAQCFSRVITLGRQELQHLSGPSLASLLGEYGHPATAAQAASILRDADGFCEPLFRFLGASRVESIDNSGYESASIVHDMNLPIPEGLAGAFTAVVDGGCLEHIFNFPTAIANCMRMLAVGGRFLSITVANNFMGHGFYQFSPELFFRIFGEENGFEAERVVLYDPAGCAQWYEVKDPRVVRSRVEAVTRDSVYLYVQARKVAEVPLFRSAPQQADDSAAWAQGPAAEGARGVAPIHRAPGAAPPDVKARLKRVARQVAPPFLLSYYRDARRRMAQKPYNKNFFTPVR